MPTFPTVHHTTGRYWAASPTTACVRHPSHASFGSTSRTTALKMGCSTTPSTHWLKVYEPYPEAAPYSLSPAHPPSIHSSTRQWSFRLPLDWSESGDDG